MAEGGRITPQVKPSTRQNRGGGGGGGTFIPSGGENRGAELTAILQALLTSQGSQQRTPSADFSGEIKAIIGELIRDYRDEEKYQKRRKESKEDYRDKKELDLAYIEKQLRTEAGLADERYPVEAERREKETRKTAEIQQEGQIHVGKALEALRRETDRDNTLLSEDMANNRNIVMQYTNYLDEIRQENLAFVRYGRDKLAEGRAQGLFKGKQGLKAHGDMLHLLDVMESRGADLGNTNYQAKFLGFLRDAQQARVSGDSDAYKVLQNKLEKQTQVVLGAKEQPGPQVPTGEFNLTGDPILEQLLPDPSAFTTEDLFEARWTGGVPVNGLDSVDPESAAAQLTGAPFGKDLLRELFSESLQGSLKSDESRRALRRQDARDALRIMDATEGIRKIAKSALEEGMVRSPGAIRKGVQNWAMEFSANPDAEWTRNAEGIQRRLTAHMISELTQAQGVSAFGTQVGFEVLDGNFKLDTEGSIPVGAYLSGGYAALQANLKSLVGPTGEQAQILNMYKSLRGGDRPVLSDEALIKMNSVMGVGTDPEGILGESLMDTTAAGYQNFAGLVAADVPGVLGRLSTAMLQEPALEAAVTNGAAAARWIQRLVVDPPDERLSEEQVAKMFGESFDEGEDAEARLFEPLPRTPTTFEKGLYLYENHPLNLHESLTLFQALKNKKPPTRSPDRETLRGHLLKEGYLKPPVLSTENSGFLQSGQVGGPRTPERPPTNLSEMSSNPRLPWNQPQQKPTPWQQAPGAGPQKPEWDKPGYELIEQGP